MFKGLILLLFIAGCCPKKPEQTIVDVINNLPKTEEPEIQPIIAGSCYRYPNKNQQDVHMKVLKTYNKGGFMAEFIVEKTIFTDVHEFTDGARHMKEIDCYMFEDLKGLSKPSNG
jgi:hypothetical protein